jgi:hypothetical protein
MVERSRRGASVIFPLMTPSLRTADGKPIAGFSAFLVQPVTARKAAKVIAKMIK